MQKAAADRLVSVGLELGGKDPAYVRGDVDIAWAAEEIVDGAVFNSGQSCCSIERVYVDTTIHDRFVLEVKKVLEGYKLGDPSNPETHVGPVISKRSKETIEEHIRDALEKGATNETPENTTFKNPPAKGNFVAPTLLTGVTHDMKVMKDESFGPIIPVMQVKSDRDAVEKMNDSEFGLTASVWTKDTEKGYQIAEDVEAGTVFVNRCDYPAWVSAAAPRGTMRAVPHGPFDPVISLREGCMLTTLTPFQDLAWTGWKNSGKGVTLSRFGFDQFIKLKSYHLKDYPK